MCVCVWGGGGAGSGYYLPRTKKRVKTTPQKASFISFSLSKIMRLLCDHRITEIAKSLRARLFARYGLRNYWSGGSLNCRIYLQTPSASVDTAFTVIRRLAVCPRCLVFTCCFIHGPQIYRQGSLLFWRHFIDPSRLRELPLGLVW